MRTHTVILLLAALLIGSAATAANNGAVQPGARVYVGDIDGLGPYLTAALAKKNVPLVVTTERDKADFEIDGISESERAGWSKMMLNGSAQSREEASIMVTNLRTGDVVFAYTVSKENAIRGRQSAAEACAKHLKRFLESRD